MKKLLFALALAFIYVAQAFSQTLIVPENDSTFTTQYLNDEKLAIIIKDSIIVGISNKTFKDDYGSYYQ